MSLGQTTSAPASTWETAVRTISSSDASLSTSPSAPHDPAVAVRGVLAETDVGEQQELGEPGPQRPQRLLHDPVLDPGARALVVLRRGDAEEEHRPDPDAQELLTFAHDRLDRVPGEPRQTLVRHRLRRDEQGHHEVVGREGGLPHEVAEPARSRAVGAAGWRGTCSSRESSHSRAPGGPCRYLRTIVGSSAASCSSTSTGTGCSRHDSSVIRSAKNSHSARPTASSGRAISAPGSP